jgi:hypothetical protein
VAEGPVPVSIYVARGASPEIGDHLYMIAGTHIEA